MLQTNYHTHTYRCNHAYGEDEDYVLNAIKGGYDILGFSDHCAWPFQSGYISPIRMEAEDLEKYAKSITYLKNKYKHQIQIHLGLECEYFPPYIKWLKEESKRLEIEYLILGNHFYESEEKFPYFGHGTHNKEMLELYLESAIKGMESGLFTYFAHPDLFMRSYPFFDQHCEKISREICQKARKLSLPLEYNISYIQENESKGIVTFPHPHFWAIAADEGCTAIIGVDAHDPSCLSHTYYYNRAINELKALNIKRLTSLL